jgi:hypothetical protein
MLINKHLTGKKNKYYQGVIIMFRIFTSVMTVAICSVAFSAEKKAAAPANEPSLTRVNIDTTKSVINWKGTKAFVGDSHVGTVIFSSGALLVDKDKITGGDLTIDMKSIKATDVTDASMNGKLVGHLKSEDFFAAVRKGYLDLAKKNPARVVLLDASLSMSALASQIQSIISHRMNSKKT